MDELMAICHKARKGRYNGSHCSNHVAPLLYSTYWNSAFFASLLEKTHNTSDVTSCASWLRVRNISSIEAASTCNFYAFKNR